LILYHRFWLILCAGELLLILSKILLHNSQLRLVSWNSKDLA
jgi:hypothetical protein